MATYGQLFDAAGKQIAVTLEEPWKENRRNVSCIPAASYVAYRRRSPKRGYDLFELLKVPGRSNIEIHIGNTTKDTEGCILLGTNFGQVNGFPGIIGSAVAFRRFMFELTGIDRITIEILAPEVPATSGAV